jgi:hypothetical protein
MKMLFVAMAAALIASPAYAEQIEVSGHDTLSIGDHGKILNNTVFACKTPGDPALRQLNAGQLLDSASALADGECSHLAAGTEVELVETASAYPSLVCIRTLSEQSCAWTFKLAIEPVAVYDREQADIKKNRDEMNALFDRDHPECKVFRTNPNLPKYTATEKCTLKDAPHELGQQSH